MPEKANSRNIINDSRKENTMKTLSQEELKQFYTGEYVANFSQRDQYEKIAKLLKHISLRQSDVIADFGCGSGLLLDYVSDRVTAYYGVDFSEEFISLARAKAEIKHISNAHFVCDDISHFCQQYPNTFDSAFTLDFSEHIYDEMFISIYTGIRHSLKEKGLLYLHTPNREFIIERLRRRQIFFQPLPEHIAVRSASQYRTLLKQVGFSKIIVQYVPHYVPLLSYLHLFAFYPVIGKYLRARLFIICEK